MRKLLLAVPFLLAALAAHADLVIQQNIESPFITGDTVTKIKGDQMRVDSPMPGGGNVTTIINTASGDATTLMHAQKMAMKMNLNEMQKAMKQAGGADASKVTPPKATGQKEKVGTFDTEVYEINANGQTIKVWAAKDYPNAAAIKDQMNKAAKATSGGMFDPAQFDVPGMIVKTEINSPQGKIVTSLKGVKEEPVADTEFQIPNNYQEMKMPQMPGQK